MERNIEIYAAKLGDAKIDSKTKTAVATEIRDSIENLCSPHTFPKFLSKLWPVFRTILQGEPEFRAAHPDHILRNQILEILHRLHINSTDIERYAVEMVDTLMELVPIENEDNAVLCMKTIMDLERHQMNATATRVQPFLELIQEMFQMMEQVVKDTFDAPSNGTSTSSATGNTNHTSQSPRPGSPATTVSDSGIDKKDQTPLAKGMQSFKVLAECPIIVVSIFQVHRNSVSANVKKFVPLIKGILLLQAKPQEKAHAEAAAAGTIFTGVCKEIKNRAAFGEFITAQVKTMSFLAYLLRVYSQHLNDFLPTLPGVVVRLLKDCPREKSSSRKELLVAIRHIINFNYRKIFLQKIDELLDERTLIGDGLTVYETMRPLAYSMLADLIHHVRESLKRDQIRRTIEVYTRNLHDNFPGTSFQTMSAKLLLNMAESITKLDNKEDARYFLIMILDAIGDKFAAMNYQYPNAVKLSQQYSKQPEDAPLDSNLAGKERTPDWDEIDIFTAAPIKTSNPRDRGADPVADNVFLFKNLVNGLKAMFFQLKTCNPTDVDIDNTHAPVNWPEVSFGYNAEEVRVITKLFHEGIRVFRYYNTEQQLQDAHFASPVEFLASHFMAQMSREEKELLESFGTVFHCIDTATFHEVFQTEIPHLHKVIFEHTALLHLPQFFLASEATSPAFAGMVLQYLMDRIEDVGSAEVVKSSILLRLFKLSFMAVTLFSTQNEQVLHPHITKIVTKCVQLSVTADEPMNYFLLLRSLFRSIGGGRFELLYKEILPLLEMLLETFNHLLQGARKASERDLYVELTLTVPARLSHLLPHLNHLMKPLVVALRAGSELVGQGLRTLELCVDNLTADYLDPIMAPIMDDLMTALWDHLRPNPYSHFHAHTTMRILGKLGGRNRKFLNHPPQLAFKHYSDDEPSFDLRLLDSTKDRAFGLDIGLDLAISKLSEIPKTSAAKVSDTFYKEQSFKLIISHVKLLIGFDALPEDFAALLRLEADALLGGKLDDDYEIIDLPAARDNSIQKRRSQELTLKKLLKASILATTIPDLSTVASSFVTDICRHFTVIEVGRALADAKRKTKEFEVGTGEGLMYLDTRILADVFVESLASDDIRIREATEEAMTTVRDTASAIFGSIERAAKLPFFQHLAKTFCHNCHEAEWFTKAGSALAIQVLALRLDLGDEWLLGKQIDFTRALLFVIKDTPHDVPSSTRIQAQATLEAILRRAIQGLTKETLANEKSKLYALCGIFVQELSHMTRHVREAAQQAFAVMAEVAGAEPYELIAPVKDRLLQPIFNKPLRALPFLTQIGFIEAVTYCLGLGHDLVPFNDQLMRLMMESLALSDADDDTLAPKPNEFNNAELIISLRVACLRLLSMAMSFPDFANAPQNTTRARTIAVFFKSLYSRSPEVIDAANAGLKDVLTQTNKLPKDLLQNGLRPILMNLQDPKRLSVAGLDGLARLLTLLTNYFKVEIGARLLEHMKVIADEPTLQQVSFGLIEQNPQMKIVAAIFHIFHLLPPAATTFMQDLVNAVLDLEAKLRRTTFSPFRTPLVRYLSRYPKEACAFFLSKVQDEKYGRFFAQILADPEAESLRGAVVTETPALVASTFEITAAEARITASISAISIVHAVCTNSETPEWFPSHPGLKSALLVTGKDLYDKLRRDTLPSNQRLRVEQAGDNLMGIFTSYLSTATDDLDFMFEVLQAAAMDQIKVPLSLTKFLYTAIIQSRSVEYRRAVISRSIEHYSEREGPQKIKTFLFHNLVNPLFAMDVKNMTLGQIEKSELMDKSMCDMLHLSLWKPQTGDISEESAQQGVDHSRMEVLQLSALLIKYHKDIVSEARKDIIKFAWSYIRLEDIINKYAAYVLISYFIWAYETPTKVAMQIYVALLKAHQNEGRALVTQALEILAQILPQRVALTGDVRYPPWSRWPRRILAEETGNLQQVTSIFHFLIRQPDLFYESREYFVPLIVPSLHKIASAPNPSNESKKLALGLVALISQWEARRIHGPKPDQIAGTAEGSPSSKRDAAGAIVLGPPATRERAEYIIPPELRKAVIKYLITFITILQERYPVPAAEIKSNALQKAQQQPMSNEMCKKAVQLLRDLLSPGVWADIDIDLYPKVMDPLLVGDKADKPDEKHLTCMVNALQVIRVMIHSKPQEWIVAHLPALQKLLEKSLRMDNLEIQDCLNAEDEEDEHPRLKSLLRLVLDAIPDEQPEDEDMMETDSTPSEFVTFLSTIASEALAAGSLKSSINILWTLSQVKPAEMDLHISQVMRALQATLAKEHVDAWKPPPPPLPPGYRPGELTMDPYDFAVGVNLIKKTIDVLFTRMSQLGEQRRAFLSVLASLVEKSLNTELCLKILDMVEPSIFSTNESLPTLKEKTAVLHKMLLFEQRQDPSLLKRFLELVIKIYEDPKVTRTELTVRLEHAFLIGTRANDVEMRNRFMAIFDQSLSRTASTRLNYVLTLQNWDTLADSFWLKQAVQLVMGSVNLATSARLHADDFKVQPASLLFGPEFLSQDRKKEDVMLDSKLEDLEASERRFNREIGEVKVGDILEPLIQLQHVNTEVSYDLWVKIFPLCWASLSREDRVDLEKGMVSLLTKEYHSRQLNLRPNVIQALLEGAARAKPRFKMPQHALKFLSRTYDGWYIALVSLEEATVNPALDTPAVRESNLDALIGLYAGLQEDDLFYGTWRRRCKFTETNAALSYEQQGIWDRAQQLYEAAQVKARTGVVPFSQGEYFLWEDHWLLCAQKMQQWEILSEFAKHENFNDLLLEAAWRNYEAWQGESNRDQLDSMIKSVSDAPTPRRTFLQAFMSLLKFHSRQDSRQEFNHVCDEAIQLSIRKWHQLPKRITNAHVPILQNFQQLVELHDASVICDSLHQTNVHNLDSKSQELKLLLVAWRDRLPNVWDDINAWQDLVTWRQHVFQLINNVYLQLVPQGANTNVANNSYAYRGFHETAWIINRFAHVARKHQMPDVCITQLSKIYTLPNIEIQEAFLKLREQAKCHYQNEAELNNGLDVINNTNLNYFGAQQKAEFYTLKGMFLAKLKQQNEANEAFGIALYYDLRLPKAWAEWGQYSDRRFKKDPQDMELASNAVSCYLEAAGLYKSAKSRKLLSRILWLLSLDGEEGKIAAAFENFKGETPVWYWITFVPQLLSSLEHREARIARVILSKIAKLFPQSLFFQLRTSREELLTKKKQNDQRMAAKQHQQSPHPGKSSSPDASASRPGTANGDTPAQGTAASPKPKQEPNGDAQVNGDQDSQRDPPKKPWEYVEEIMAGLKTAFPLLALSMETMTEQIQKNFKCPPDEDAYRLIVALLNDGLAYVGRAPQSYAQDVKLPASTEANIGRFAETILPGHIRKAFEADFVVKKPTMFEYIQKLRRWRDKFEERLDCRQQWATLESYSQYLSEFRFLKFDEVEVPGQYLQHRDKNTDFTRIERFMPTVGLIRTVGMCHRRLTIRGHDGSLQPFAVQHPAARHCRREERILQLFRIFNTVLTKRKETRRRNLYFHLPLMIPVAPHIRLVQEDTSYISLQGIYEDNCRKTGMSKDEPILFTMEKLRAMAETKQNRTPEQVTIMKTEILTAVQEKWVPNTIMLEYAQGIYPNFEDFWLFRRQFSYQYAAITFITYIMHMCNRFPNKINVARATGDIWASELTPNLNPQRPLFYNPEHVPFRLTPNVQTLMGPLAIEGIFACAIMAVARCLTEPEYELESQLSIFVRDEMFSWAANQKVVNQFQEAQLRETVGQNTDFIVKRALSLAKTPEGGGAIPANQTVIDLVSRAVNPVHLAQADALWMAYL